MAALMTEYANNEKGCHLQRVRNEAGIGHAYWHYNNYCNTAGCGSCTADRAASCPLISRGRFSFPSLSAFSSAVAPTRIW